MSGPRQSSRAGNAASTEPRVSTLVGDRLCIKCGYNLTGQPVKREAHYDMLIVRCPECATVASLQEYPLLGRWAGRWAMLLAALWFGFVLLLALASAGILYAEADSVAETASRPHAIRLAERQHKWFKEREAQGTLPANAQWFLSNPNPPSSYSPVDPTWSSQQDFDAVLAEAGGWAAAADFSALRRWIKLALWAAPIGCFWAIALAHVRRRRLILFGLILISLAGVFALIGHLGQPGRFGMFVGWGWGWTNAITIAQRQIGPPFYAMSLLFSIIPLSLGLVFGRPIVRGLIRALLPPRLRSSLALLWTADGLEPPLPRPSGAIPESRAAP